MLENFNEFRASIYKYLSTVFVAKNGVMSVPPVQLCHSLLQPWRLMTDMRNLIAHEYFRVDSEIVWDTVQNNIPGLIEPLQKLLDSEEIL